jgi:hypothetical protein
MPYHAYTLHSEPNNDTVSYAPQLRLIMSHSNYSMSAYKFQTCMY